MNIIKTDIEGVLMIEPNLFRDKRDYILESFNEREFNDKISPIIGHKINFCQDNESMSFYGVAYDRVNNFLIENKINPEKYHNDFEFSHVSLITYGRKELYMNNNIKDKNPKERGER